MEAKLEIKLTARSKQVKQLFASKQRDNVKQTRTWFVKNIPHHCQTPNERHRSVSLTHEHFAPNLVAQIPRANKPRDTRFDDRLTSHVCWSVSPLQLLQTSNQNKKNTNSKSSVSAPSSDLKWRSFLPASYSPYCFYYRTVWANCLGPRNNFNRQSGAPEGGTSSSWTMDFWSEKGMSSQRSSMPGPESTCSFLLGRVRVTL